MYIDYKGVILPTTTTYVHNAIKGYGHCGHLQRFFHLIEHNFPLYIILELLSCTSSCSNLPPKYIHHAQI